MPIKITMRGAWVAQSVKLPILDFNSGHDLTIHEMEPHIRLHAGNTEPAWNSLSAPPLLTHTLSLSKSINIKKITVGYLF